MKNKLLEKKETHTDSGCMFNWKNKSLFPWFCGHMKSLMSKLGRCLSAIYWGPGRGSQMESKQALYSFFPLVVLILSLSGSGSFLGTLELLGCLDPFPF